MNKSDFKILKSKLTYLDSAASAQKPKSVLKAMDDFYTTTYSNVHRGTCKIAETATEMYEQSRLKVARFLGAKPQNIVFTKGATEAVNLVANGFVQTLKPGDEVLMSISEHHAVFVPVQQACLKTGAKLRIIKLQSDGSVDMNDLRSQLNTRVKLIAVTHMSNVMGVVNPVEEVVACAKAFGAKTLVDGAQAVAHTPVDVSEIGCDYYVFSGHKLYGPTGIGVLYGKKEALADLPPYQYGGDMIREVKVDITTFADAPTKFEAGTPPIAEAIGLAAAIDYVTRLNMYRLADHEQKLTKMLIRALEKIDGVQILGEGENKAGLVAFTVRGIHPSDIAFALGKDGICVRVGHHCAMPLHASLGITASLRVSFGLYNDKKDVNKFIKSLKKSLSFF